MSRCPSYNGILYSDYKTDSTLIDSLQETNKKGTSFFLEHDSTKSFKDYVIHFPSQDSLGLKKVKGTSWYLEIGKPIEGWENLILYENMRKGVYENPQYFQNYSRNYLSIPVIVFKLDKGIVNQEAVMVVYKIFYKETKVQFVKKFSF